MVIMITGQGLAEFYKGKKVFVTGHSGFKGSWLTEMLAMLGADVSGFSLEPDTTPNLFSVLGHWDLERNHFGDVRDFDALSSAIRQDAPDILFHMAAQPLVRDSYDAPRYTFETNLMGTVNVLDALRETGGVKAAVIVTTDKVYENLEQGSAFREEDKLGGRDPYSASKACAEHASASYSKSFFDPDAYGDKHRTLVATARAGNVVGGGDWSKDRLVPDIIRAISERDESIMIRSPDAVRPWQHVLDPLHGYLLLAKGLHEGNTGLAGAWNFAPARSSHATVKDIVEMAITRMGKGSYSVKEEGQKHEMRLLRLDAAKAVRRLDWNQGLDLDATLDWTFEWYRRFYDKDDMKGMTRSQIERYLSDIHK